MCLVKISRLRTDGGTQCREGGCKPAIIEEYAAAILAGAKFPEVVAFQDVQSNLWLADGFYRVFSHAKAGKEEIACTIRNGTQRDAILYAAGANDTHGQKRTNKDKENAVHMILADAEWREKSDRWIGEVCKVNHETVGRIRKGISPSKNGDSTEDEEEQDDTEESDSGGDFATCNNGKDGQDVSPKRKKGKDGKTYTTGGKKGGKKGTKKAGEGTKEPPKDLADEEGHKVPDNLLPAFASLEKWKELDSLARKLQDGIDTLAQEPGGEKLHHVLTKETRKDKEGKEYKVFRSDNLQLLKANLKGVRPHAVCPRCKGTAKKDCKLCMGHGWVTKTAWNGEQDAKGK